MKNIFFDSWESVIRTIVITVLAYVIMIVMLRVSGKRTLSKMNAFDFIITIALGSTLATVALSKNVALIDGALGFFLLIFLQYSLTWLSVRYKGVKKLVTSEPALLLYKGEVLEDVMKKERITLEEIYLAARKEGIADIHSIHAIILETTGSLTIISSKKEDTKPDTLKNVRYYP